MSKYKLNESVLQEKVGDDIIIVNLNNDKMYELNPTGSILLQKMLEGQTIKEIKTFIVDLYDVEEEILSTEIDEIINDLLKEGILTKG